MPGIKELKTRIKSISGTRKVTRAMQMVSAAKMRKSQDATMRSRTYASLAWELIGNLTSALAGVIPENRSASDGLSGIQNQELDAGSGSGMTQLMRSFPKATKIAVLILTTNRGMVGSLNANLLAMVQSVVARFIEPNEPDKSGNYIKGIDFITYGRKGRDVIVRSTRAPVADSGAGRGKEVLADFEKFDRTITTEDIFPIAELITKLYSSGKYQKVLIFYNHFVSTLVQKPTVKQLLPFNKISEERIENREKDSALSSKHYSLSTKTDYLFEPDPQKVLKHLLPRIIESQIYQTILESEASEQSARMVMMKNATEAAGDLISDLTLTYNKLRQNKITTELAEITAGKIALE